MLGSGVQGFRVSEAWIEERPCTKESWIRSFDAQALLLSIRPGVAPQKARSSPTNK